jgi:hypothetical protein
VLTGYVNADGEALDCPVGVAVDRAGALLVADDVDNTVWRVIPSPGNIAKVQRQRFIEPADRHDTTPFVGREYGKDF